MIDEFRGQPELSSADRHPTARCDLCAALTRKKTLKDFTGDDLLSELAARFADQHYRSGMTMSQTELAVWEAYGIENPAALRALNALLARLPLEAPTGKCCPKCNKRIAAKAKDRTRSLRTMAGALTLTRNYHYCEDCQLGFDPLDRVLQLPEEGELTAEMEKRVLVLRSTRSTASAPRAGACTTARPRPTISSAAWSLASSALRSCTRCSGSVTAPSATGAWPSNCSPAPFRFSTGTTRSCTRWIAEKVPLGEVSPWLPLWLERSKQLLAAGEPRVVIDELMACLALSPRRRSNHDALEALNGLVRSFQTNAHRMRYALSRDSGFPIASGAAESAHRHVLQVRMKRAGQHRSMRNAPKAAVLRAAFRTAGPLDLYNSIQRARARSRTQAHSWLRGHYRYTREGARERRRCLAGSSELIVRPRRSAWVRFVPRVLGEAGPQGWQ
jgi:hypothetical protein